MNTLLRMQFQSAFSFSKHKCLQWNEQLRTNSSNFKFNMGKTSFEKCIYVCQACYEEEVEEER